MSLERPFLENASYHFKQVIMQIDEVNWRCDSIAAKVITKVKKMTSPYTYKYFNTDVILLYKCYKIRK